MSFPFPVSPKPNICEFEIFENPLGEGNFSLIKHAKWNRGNLDVALKIVSKAHVERMRKQEDVLMEKHALMRNIIRLYGTFADPQNIYLATEYCAGGELWEQCKFVGEPEYRSKVYFVQIIDAVMYMHRMGIVHRDLKAENVLLSGDLQSVKLCDFGSSRDLFNPEIKGSRTPNSHSRQSSFTHYVGTSNFIAPEAISNSENDILSDIWSLGCLFYQVLCGIPPFVAGSDYLVYIRIRAGDLQIPPYGLSDSAHSLLESIIQVDRLNRPSLDTIKFHSFFQDTQPLVPPYNPDDSCIRSIVRQNQSIIPNMHQTSQYFSDRFHLTKTVAQWRDLSAPGKGIAMVEHLIPHVPELKSMFPPTKMTNLRKPLGDLNSQSALLGLGDVVDEAAQFANMIDSPLSRESIAVIVSLLNKYPDLSPHSLKYIFDELRGAVERRRGRCIK